MREYLAKPEIAEAYLKACLDDGNPWLIADAYRLIGLIHGRKREIRIRLEDRKTRRVTPRRNPRQATTKRTAV